MPCGWVKSSCRTVRKVDTTIHIHNKKQRCNGNLDMMSDLGHAGEWVLRFPRSAHLAWIIELCCTFHNHSFCFLCALQIILCPSLFHVSSYSLCDHTPHPQYLPTALDRITEKPDIARPQHWERAIMRLPPSIYRLR